MRIGIIGAGASGLLLATKLEKLNIDYMIFNAGKVGRKILASGNGRCNIAHKDYDEEDYFHHPLALHVLDQNALDVFSYFEELNIYTKVDDEGRMYPISESSLSVLNVLLKNIHTKITDLEITSITKRKNQYYLNDGYGPFDKIVIATGSNASFKRPYPSVSFFDSLNIKINPFVPCLVGFTTMKKIKAMSGSRSKCHVSLFQNHKLIHEESGEVIFKDNGVSGIVIMNMSSYYQHLESKADCYLSIDFCYKKNYKDYTTILQPKILEYLEATHQDIHAFTIPISGVYDVEFAQVCKGGVDSSEVDLTLSLKKDKNVYICGEALDIDALCGGYNLLFAWSSALHVAKEIQNEISNK